MNIITFIRLKTWTHYINLQGVYETKICILKINNYLLIALDPFVDVSSQSQTHPPFLQSPLQSVIPFLVLTAQWYLPYCFTFSVHPYGVLPHGVFPICSYNSVCSMLVQSRLFPNQFTHSPSSLFAGPASLPEIIFKYFCSMLFLYKINR